MTLAMMSEQLHASNIGGKTYVRSLLMPPTSMPNTALQMMFRQKPSRTTPESFTARNLKLAAETGRSLSFGAFSLYQGYLLARPGFEELPKAHFPL
jgi:hypothetical protein